MVLCVCVDQAFTHGLFRRAESDKADRWATRLIGVEVHRLLGLQHVIDLVVPVAIHLHGVEVGTDVDEAGALGGNCTDTVSPSARSTRIDMS